MSTVLFNIYINGLVIVLSNAKAGCYISQHFMETFGYADDIILLAPYKQAFHILLGVTLRFSKV